MWKSIGSIIMGLGIAFLRLFVWIVAALAAFVGGPVAAIWLLVLGGWKLVLLGALFAVLMPIVYSTVCMPGLGLAALAVKSVESGRLALSGVIALIGTLYQYGIILLWSLVAFGLVALGSPFSLPSVIWAYAVMIGPLLLVASHEDEGGGVPTLSVVFYCTCVFFWRIEYQLIGGDFGLFLYPAVGLGAAISIIASVIAIFESLNMKRVENKREPLKSLSEPPPPLSSE